MFKMYFLPIITLFVFETCNAQTETEVAPPFNIKTISFVQNSQNITPIFQLGDGFQLQFDDLFGNEANYYYTLTLCDYDWKPSELSKNEYLQGFDDQRIQDYTNSFNTLQIYSHYNLPFPNKFTQFKVSGNYMLKILNEDKEVVFSKKFILYENLATVPIQVRRARNGLDLSTKQDLDFSVKSTFISFQNPTKNVKVLLIQNGQLQNAISNVVPQYTIGNDLIYKYDTQTQFWAGNEFLYFDTKDIRVPANYVSYVDSNSGIYNSHLFGNNARAKYPYTYYPDVNGNFVIRRLNAENQDIESDYSWVFFTLTAPSYFGKGDIYINGMFNNFSLTADNKMDYNAQKGIYEKAIMIKQGFTNYQYVIANKSGKIDSEQAIDGNYYQTENNYSILVYYRENGQRNDRIIGKGDASSENIIN
jgi:Domain of unknown function (DUF5103)